jgi:tetratricopeptide (TPR) repeat protein
MLVQVLPPHLWGQTSLRHQLPQPSLESTFVRPWREGVGGLPGVFVCNIRPDEFAQIAAHLTDRAGTKPSKLPKDTSCYVDPEFDRYAPAAGFNPQQVGPQEVDEIYRDFIQFASQDCRRAAQHIACVPDGNALTLPLMRLIQRTLVHDAAPWQLAELFLYGLLYRVRMSDASLGDPHYLFLGNLRQRLREDAGSMRRVETQVLVSRYLRQREGKGAGFEAFVAAELDGPEGAAKVGEEPFATVPGAFVGSARGAFQVDVATVRSYAEHLAASGKTEEAILNLQESIKRDPQRTALLYLDCANLLVKTGKAEEGVALLQEGIDAISPPENEELQRLLRDLLQLQRPMIFISYRITDSLDIIARLEADLASEFGDDAVFRDKSRLHGGHDWTKELKLNAVTCQVMLVVIGASWQTISHDQGDWKGVPRLLNPSDWVRKEVTLALDAGNTVIPVFLNDAVMPSEGWLANCQLERLYRKQGEKIHSVEYADDLANLITGLRRRCPELPNKSIGNPPPAKLRLPTRPEGHAVTRSSIFLSYRITDALDLIGRLDADLAREFGADAVFRDKSRLQGGFDWPKELEHNAVTCQVMLVVIGSSWQNAASDQGDWKGIPRLLNPSDWVRKEITLALDAGNTVIPVFLNDAAMPSEGWLANCQLERLYRKQGEIIRSTEYANDLAKLVALLRKLGLQSKTTIGASHTKLRLPLPPEVYAVPNYILTSTFIGRATELDELDAWASSTDPMLVVEGIGGLGKSALTWEWMLKRAQYAIPNLAGRVWWSFYERDASMAAFVRHAIAYITEQDPDALTKETSHYQRCQELLTELKHRPFLLVLDGFERILTAYHRWDKAQDRDDKIVADLRECTDPRDGELLRQLLHGSPSKVILCTRLFPHILEDRASRDPVLGVAHHILKGLSRSDALAFFRQAGVKGNEKAMLEFADQFGRHSLLLKVVCGEIASYPRMPYDFEAWRADTNYGGKLKLSELDLKQNYNHILHFALDGLEEPKRKLLCRIAVLSENVNYETISVLNPYLPARPEVVARPDHPSKSYGWERLSEEEREQRLGKYQLAQNAFHNAKQALESHHGSAAYRQAILALDNALKELQDRGLLQWDRDTRYYDMHPVIRGYAADFLDESDREETFLTVRDHLASLPQDDFEKATELSQVAHSIDTYRTLVGAGRLDEAVRFYSSGLSTTLWFHLGAYALIVELLTPLFRGSKDGLPQLTSSRDQSFVLTDLAFALSELGRDGESQALLERSLQIDVEQSNWTEVARHLQNIAACARSLNRHAESSAALALAQQLATATDPDGVTVAVLSNVRSAIEEGRFAIAQRWLVEFHQRAVPSVAADRPGDAEYLFCLLQFYQGVLTERDWQRGYQLAVQYRNIRTQHRFLALHSEWLLTQDLATPALNAIEEALKIVNRLGAPSSSYHDLHAWALARLGRSTDSRAELAAGEQQRFAAEAWFILGDREQARTCALNAYRVAWGEGPPYIRWYELERSKALLRELGEPEPQLPPFDPTKVKPIPFEREIREAIRKLSAKD